MKDAFGKEDPVRRLIVTVRAALLNKTVPQYAAELGIQSNTLSRFEAKGFEPSSSVVTSFYPFIADWRKRAQEPNPEAFFFVGQIVSSLSSFYERTSEHLWGSCGNGSYRWGRKRLLRKRESLQVIYGSIAQLRRP
jgi:hypothetical protein